jgi:hypothetical protein
MTRSWRPGEVGGTTAIQKARRFAAKRYVQSREIRVHSDPPEVLKSDPFLLRRLEMRLIVRAAPQPRLWSLLLYPSDELFLVELPQPLCAFGTQSSRRVLPWKLHALESRRAVAQLGELGEVLP